VKKNKSVKPNSQYGTMWINNGIINKKIKKEDTIENGFIKGRINVHSLETRKIIALKSKNNNPEKRKNTMLERYGGGMAPQVKAALSKYYEQLHNDKLLIPWDEKSIRYKRIYLLEEQQNKCLHCYNDTWLGDPITLELDHIDGNTKNNEKSNLRLLCPNCHSQTNTWRRKKTSLK
jgi:hypothetical protein